MSPMLSARPLLEPPMFQLSLITSISAAIWEEGREERGIKEDYIHLGINLGWLEGMLGDLRRTWG